VVVATSPQFFAAGAGWLTALVRRRPFVFEVRDLWPESIRAVGAVKSERLLNALEAMELFLYRRARAVVTVTRAFRADLARRGIDPAKVHVVTNGADLVRFQPRRRDDALAAQLGLSGRFVAGYVGTHGMAHGLDTLLDAAARLRSHDDIALLFLGDGAEKQALKDRAHTMGLPNVVFLDSVPKEEVARYWSLLDVSIIHLKKTPLFETVIPSKLFEGMAMGVPVLHGVAGESAEIVRRESVGETFVPEDSAALADAIQGLAADPARRRAMSLRAVAAATRYDRKALAADMLEVLERVVRLEPRPSVPSTPGLRPAVPLPRKRAGEESFSSHASPKGEAGEVAGRTATRRRGRKATSQP
jgi:hypothetical protein